MTNPQTVAKRIYEEFKLPMFKPLAEYSCCAITLLWVLHVEEDDIGALKIISTMIDRKVLRSDCTVLWYESVEFITGKKPKDVIFKKIKSLKGLKERCEVLYTYTDINGKTHGHWVGVEKEKIAFNSLAYSNCVKFGKPTEARIIVF